MLYFDPALALIILIKQIGLQLQYLVLLTVCKVALLTGEKGGFSNSWQKQSL